MAPGPSSTTSISLKQWMIDGSLHPPYIPSNDRSDRDDDDEKGQKKQPPSVLILDGGVSTHLEELQNNNNNRPSSTSTVTADSISSSLYSHSLSSPSTPSFQYRSLWSSSLLLKKRGQNDIRTSHETFYDSGCNIISTVTYQLSHFVCESSTKRTKMTDVADTSVPSVSNNNNHRAETEEGEQDDQDQEALSSANIPPHFTEDDVDSLLKLGVELAHETRMKKMNERTQKQQQVEQQSGALSLSLSSPSLPILPLYVVASIGCYGAALADGSEYRGNYGVSLDKLMMFHRRRFNVFMDLNNDVDNAKISKECNNSEETKQHVPLKLDGIAFETVPSLIEIEAIVNVVKERKKAMLSRRGCKQGGQQEPLCSNHENVATWISLACKDDKTLNDGTLLTEALDIIERLDSDIDGEILINGIGVNCFDIKHAKSLTSIIASHQLSSNSNRAIIFYPNSGEEWDAANETWLRGSGCSDPNEFAEYVVDSIRFIKEMFDQCGKGQRKCKIIVGGCCRTSPATIKSIRNGVDVYMKAYQ